MQFDLAFATFAAIVVLACVAEAATGFGATVIAVTLGALLYPVTVVVAPLVPANVLVLGYLVARHHGRADWRHIRGRILPWMGAGTLAGLALAEALAGPVLQRLFGALVVALAIREVVAWWRGGAGTAPRPSPAIDRAALFGAGVTHGLFATGGPLLVYAVSRTGADRRAFRSTVAAVLLVLNVGLVGAYVATGRLTPATLPFVGALVPAAVAGIAAGEWVHGRVPEASFRAAVFALLGLAGLASLVG